MVADHRNKTNTEGLTMNNQEKKMNQNKAQNRTENEKENKAQNKNER